MTKINPNIFKEYDVRGICPKEFNEKSAYKIGQMFMSFLKLKPGDKIAVGKDKRKTSPKLMQALVSGLIDAGVNVIDIGTVTTPMLYFSIPFLKTKGGAMITASHNPLKFNGIKFANEHNETVGGLTLKKFINSKIKKQKKLGSIKKIDIRQNYYDKAYGGIGPDKKISYSFDYDSDRLMIKGFRGDAIGGIVGESIAKKGDRIIYDITCSHAIPEYFKNKGVIAVPSKVGHLNIKKTMKQERAVFGMELTGHYYFKNFHYSESPDYALRKITEQLKSSGKKLSELAKPFTKYSHSGEININFNGDDSRWGNILQKLRENYKNGAIDFTDGITVDFSNWWFNARRSKTEPKIRLVIEAHSEKLMKEKIKELKKHF